jgi:uncharacterized protein
MRKLAFTGFLLIGFITTRAQTKNFIDQPYLEVTGNADTLVTPNEIFIRILLSEKDTKDRTSVEELESKMVAALKALGINTEKALTVYDMASNFRSYLLKGKDVLKTKQYLLKVTDAVTASKVFMQLDDLNISNASVESVDYSEMENLKNFMRSKAVENAKARAVALTKPLNQTVGVAINIVDNASYVTNSRNEALLNEVVVVTGYSRRAQAGIEPPQIDFEKIKVTANVNVKFVLK